MKSLKGPALFLAQFMGDTPPFDSLGTICEWTRGIGYEGVQLPSWDARCIDLEQAAGSQAYCDDLVARVGDAGLAITEISTHLQGQLVAVHPAYDELFDAFAPAELHGKPKERTAWAVKQVENALRASRRLGCDAMPTFSGALVWPYAYPWPQRPAGLVEEGFAELARRWAPLLAVAEEVGVDCAYEIHPGEDLHDGVTFERFLAATGNHERVRILYDPSHFVLQGLDYLAYIDHYHEHIRAFHVKDAEFVPDGRTGAYGGYLDWKERAGRFRSLGDGQIDWNGVFTRLARYGFDGWAVVEWECAYKDSSVGAAEGATRVKEWIIDVTERSFDDFAGGSADAAQNRRILGLDS